MLKGRIMAFDYGMKRTGVAVSDESCIFAFPLETIETLKLMLWIEDYLKLNNIERFVIGKPTRADGSDAEIESHILGFIRRLKNKYPDKQFARVDERYTSKMAFEKILAGGVPKMKRRNKSLVDKISASIILETYLEDLKNEC